MDRRNFLMKAAAGSGLVLLPSILTSCDIVDTSDDKDVTNDIKILTSAALMEGTAMATYNAAAAKNILSPGVLSVAVSFRNHHSDHALKLNEVIVALGGTAANFNNSSADSRINTVSNEADILKLATNLELGAAKAYFTNVSGSLVTPEAKYVMANILPTELAHYSLLRSARSLEASYSLLSDIALEP